MSFTIPPIVFTILEGILIVFGAYFVLFWFGLIAWTVQDVSRRTRDWLVRIISFLLVAIFHIPGLIIYLVIRPQETLAVVDGRAIEEEALLQVVEEKISCPHCHKAAQPDYAVCPFCGERLKTPCVSCGRLLALNWTVCPTCATPVRPVLPQTPAPLTVTTDYDLTPTPVRPAQPEAPAPQVERGNTGQVEQPEQSAETAAGNQAEKTA